MFIINITYKTDLSRVDSHIKAHINFLEEYYTKGIFQASGRKVPRTGGIILSTCSDKAELEQILNKDPFKINALADYEIIEFIPSKTSEAFEFLLP